MTSTQTHPTDTKTSRCQQCDSPTTYTGTPISKDGKTVNTWSFSCIKGHTWEIPAHYTRSGPELMPTPQAANIQIVTVEGADAATKRKQGAQPRNQNARNAKHPNAKKQYQNTCQAMISILEREIETRQDQVNALKTAIETYKQLHPDP